jgi:hypothetical protein
VNFPEPKKLEMLCVKLACGRRQEYLIKPPIQTIIDLCQIELWGDVDPDITFEFAKKIARVDAGRAVSFGYTWTRR